MTVQGLPDGPVVVLGGGGFIGANLVKRLVAEGHEVYAVDVAYPEFRLEALAGAQLVERDLRQPVDGFLSPTVFHLAADMGGVGYFHGPADWQAAMTNGRITNNVLTAAAEAGVKRLVYASSACALATEQTEPLGEGDLHWGTPDARYGAEKRYGAILCGLAAPHLDARAAILHTVYGPLQEHEGERMKFPAAVATKALRARETGVLNLWGNGEQVRTYLHVDDAVDRLLQLAGADANPGPIQVASEEPVTCREIANLCLELVGALDAQVEVDEGGPTGVQERRADLTRWREVFGEPTDMGYRAGFRSMLEWLESLA